MDLGLWSIILSIIFEMDDINLLYDKIIILKKVLSSKSYISSDFI
jgi:hypothetical protein